MWNLTTFSPRSRRCLGDFSKLLAILTMLYACLSWRNLEKLLSYVQRFFFSLLFWNGNFINRSRQYMRNIPTSPKEKEQKQKQAKEPQSPPKKTKKLNNITATSLQLWMPWNWGRIKTQEAIVKVNLFIKFSALEALHLDCELYILQLILFDLIICFTCVSNIILHSIH